MPAVRSTALAAAAERSAEGDMHQVKRIAQLLEALLYALENEKTNTAAGRLAVLIQTSTSEAEIRDHVEWWLQGENGRLNPRVPSSRLGEAIDALTDFFREYHSSEAPRSAGELLDLVSDVNDTNVVDIPQAPDLSPEELEEQKRSAFIREGDICAHLARMLPRHDTASLREIASAVELDCHHEGYSKFLSFCRDTITPVAKGSHRAACAIDPQLAIAIAYCLLQDPPALDKHEAAYEIAIALPEGFIDPAPVPIGTTGATIIEWYDGITIKPGHFYAGMPNEVYHSLPGVSKSSLDRIDRSPAHYRYAPTTESTRAMEMGTAIHAALLEPDLFRSEYLVLEGVTSRVRSEYKQAVKHRPASTTLTETEGAKILGMQQAAYDDPHASKYLQAMRYTELSGVTGDPDKPDEWRRIRIDGFILSGDKYIALDVKKTQDARQDAFMRSLTNYRYHVQSAFYSDVFLEIVGEPLRAFVFLAIEEEPPHGCKLYVIEDEALKIGLAEARQGYSTYIDCLRSDHWPAYDSAPTTITLTGWALKQARDEHGESNDEQ